MIPEPLYQSSVKRHLQESSTRRETEAEKLSFGKSGVCDTSLGKYLENLAYFITSLPGSFLLHAT